jgi:hypothetical protein
LEDVPHVGPLLPIWDLLDNQPSAESLHLLSFVEFTDLLNGCSPDALVRNAFVIVRMVVTARYLHYKSQELHEALPMPAINRSPTSRTNSRQCPPSTKKPRLLSLSMLSSPSAMPASSEVRLA